MARAADLAFLAAFAAGLGATSAWLLAKPFVDLPTRHPPVVIHLQGTAQGLFAGGPLLAGVTLALAGWRLWKGGRLGPDQVTWLETLVFLAGAASLISGVLLGVRR
ncbi:MAG: hypothetical protein U0P81_09735 [Holophagaceae bacterium]